MLKVYINTENGLKVGNNMLDIEGSRQWGSSDSDKIRPKHKYL